jgi:prepilin-type processing-associated H-X9-DG protein
MVTAGILLVAAMLFFPAIANSRYAARAAQCQNNLRQLGMALASYSDKAGAGYFPWVPSFGNRAFAGVYAPVLYDAGYMTEPGCLTCPAANREPVAARVPTLVEIDQATPMQLASLRRDTSRDYGYNLGVVVDGQHRAIRNRCRERFALMADSPGTSRIRDRGVNHLGRVRNILFEDGHVEAVKLDLIDKVWKDHPFQNDYGFTEAGIDGEDAVVADSATPPFGQSGILPELK